jgi:hypothetical protein
MTSMCSYGEQPPSDMVSRVSERRGSISDVVSIGSTPITTTEMRRFGNLLGAADAVPAGAREGGCPCGS